MELSRVIIFTPNVERLASFYKSSFGLTAVGETSAEWTELSAGFCNIALHKIGELSAEREGWIKLVFAARDVAAEKQRLESLGIEMSAIVSFEGIDLSDGRDPDGNYFQLSSRLTTN